MIHRAAILLAFILLLLPWGGAAQEQRIFDETVRTLQVCADGNPTLPPWLITCTAAFSTLYHRSFMRLLASRQRLTMSGKSAAPVKFKKSFF